MARFVTVRAGRFGGGVTKEYETSGGFTHLLIFVVAYASRQTRPRGPHEASTLWPPSSLGVAIDDRIGVGRSAFGRRSVPDRSQAGLAQTTKLLVWCCALAQPLEESQVTSARTGAALAPHTRESFCSAFLSTLAFEVMTKSLCVPSA